MSFSNPHGLDRNGNVSTSYDVAKMCYAGSKISYFKKIVSQKIHTAKIYRNESVIETSWTNSNVCLHEFEACIGIKTGVTPESGPCLSTYWKFDNKEFIVVLNNCASMENRFPESYSLACYFNQLLC